MIWLIYILNLFLWIIAGVVIGGSIGSILVGFLFFILGYIFSLIVLRYSDNYAVSELDRLKHPPFTIWIKKMVWSNGIAGVLVMVVLFLLSSVAMSFS